MPGLVPGIHVFFSGHQRLAPRLSTPRCASLTHALGFYCSEGSGAMLVTERVQALGDHARSSRQPPLKERKRAKAHENAAKTVDIDEDIFDKGVAHESAAAVIVDNAAPQTVVHENGDGAAAEITPEEEAAVLATVAAVLAKFEQQPSTADDNVTRTEAQEDSD